MKNTIVQRLKDGAGLDEASAARMAGIVLGVLVEQLAPRDRALFLAKVPAGLANIVGPAHATHPTCDSLPLFYGCVSALSGLTVTRAAELSQIACLALATELDEDTRVWLEARLPEALTELLEPKELPSRPAEAPHAPRRYPTLAEGRPGSRHPLSEARADRAHRESIARSENPHGDTKLSTSPGPTQAREHQTLAEADPRPARPLSTGKQ